VTGRTLDDRAGLATADAEQLIAERTVEANGHPGVPSRQQQFFSCVDCIVTFGPLRG
jgi:hypothetical protein